MFSNGIMLTKREQLDKDGALNPKYKEDAELAEKTFGDLVNGNSPTSTSQK